MNFAPHENEVIKEEINDQHEEMSEKDHALSNDSCFGSDMENNDDKIEIVKKYGYNMEQTEHNLEQAAQLNTREEFLAWEQQCNNFIESLEEQNIKRPQLPMLDNR
ncbi:hypothetical protein G5I_04503 [Acromyrmex echinatior]|uniref:Uncharacterized protein n=1 Tax=Acromyrmex echinatior TaxID=103372 RepID=F4WFT6_ACREC|nr:hypothetical protein G5I_04503 [Acromyrmex echinatior]